MSRDVSKTTENRLPDPEGSGSRKYPVEDLPVLLAFWLLGIIVFIQFFSRYVLNSSIAWTEEIARYLLICVCFLGSATAARKNAHLYVETVYSVLPRWFCRPLSVLVDLVKIVFYGCCVYLSVKIMPVMSRVYFTTVKWPMSIIYLVVLASFIIMTFHSSVLAWKHIRSGYVPGSGDSRSPVATNGTEE